MKQASHVFLAVGLALAAELGLGHRRAEPPALEACAGATEGWACGFRDLDVGEDHEGVCRPAPDEALRCVPARTRGLSTRPIAEGGERLSKIAARSP